MLELEKQDHIREAAGRACFAAASRDVAPDTDPEAQHQYKAQIFAAPLLGR